MSRKIAFGLIGLVAASGAALADPIAPGAVYGNKAGCAVVKSGEYPETDAMVVVTVKGIHYYESSCEFVQVLPGRNGDAFANAICAGEGEYWPSSYVLASNPEDGSLIVSSAEGGDISAGEDPLRLCAGLTIEQADKVFGE